MLGFTIHHDSIDRFLIPKDKVEGGFFIYLPGYRNSRKKLTVNIDVANFDVFKIANKPAHYWNLLCGARNYPIDG